MEYIRLQLTRQICDKCIVMAKSTTSTICPQDNEYYLLSSLSDIRKEFGEKDEPDYIVVIRGTSELLGIYKRIQAGETSVAMWSKVYA